MTITTRSKRVSIFGSDNSLHTPKNVGPGAYAPENYGSSFKAVVRPRHSGFASSQERNVCENRSTSSITPGPGSYTAALNSHTDIPAVSNAFATKVPRFAPCAPGSTIYLASSVQSNPGPGSYMQSTTNVNQTSEFYGSSNQQKAQEKKRLQAYISPPAIPNKEQSYGYIQVGTKLQLQPQPPEIYSGLGCDTVGPAMYDVKNSSWNNKTNAAPSIKSTVKRDVWIENIPTATNPGPGTYNRECESAEPQNFKHSQKSAVFASKVPILPEPRRIQPDFEKACDLQVRKERLYHLASMNKRKTFKTKKTESFGSTTNRVEIMSQLDAPFTQPTNLNTPGPGMYMHSRMKAGKSRSSRMDPFGICQPTIYIRQDENVGFSCATERYCLSKPKDPTTPGPGAYKSQSPRTLDNTMKARQTIGRFGIFGGNSNRQVWEHLERIEATGDYKPGPGAYENRKSSSNNNCAPGFKSQVKRLLAPANMSNPHVHRVGNIETPAVGQYNLEQETACPASHTTSPLNPNNNQQPTGTRQSRRSHKINDRVTAPFLSRAERVLFRIEDDSVQATPSVTLGAEYEENQPIQDAVSEAMEFGPMKKGLTRSQAVRATIANEERFRGKPALSSNIGPGAYTPQESICKKSFNVTMT